MYLDGTKHMRATIVVARDDEGSEFAIRGAHGGSVIDLTLQEAHWVQQIRQHGVQEVLQAQFGSLTAAADLQMLVDLILRLHENDLLEKIAHEDLMKSVEILAQQTRKEPVSTHSRHRRAVSVRTNARRLASGMVDNDLFPAVIGTALICLFLVAVKGNTLSLATAMSLLETPAATLVKLWFGILAASAIQSFVVGWITWATSPETIKEEPRFTFAVRAWLFLVAEFQSQPIDLLSRRAEIRVRLVALMVPWIGFCLTAWAAGTFNSQSLLAAAMSFAVIGLSEINPADRGQLVAVMEAWAREPDLLEKTREFMRRGLLRFDQKATLGQGLLSSAMMLWLTGLTLMTAELLNSSVMALGIKAADLSITSPLAGGWKELADQLAAIAWLAVMATTVIGGLVKMIAIPFENFASLASLPIKRFRPEALMRLDRAFNPESFKKAIKKLPVMAFANEETVAKIAGNPKFRKLSKGSLLQFRDGGDGQNGILLLIAGQLRDNSSGLTYTAGDCLTVAAIPGGLTATSKCVLLEIGDEVVQQALVVLGTNPPANGLPDLLRAIKLLQESAALSYLTPKQTFSLAYAGKFTSYPAGTEIIRQGEDTAHAAFLIESGTVDVKIDGKTVAESISRGGLIGSTALLKNSARSATVLTKSVTTCFEIDREAFIRASSTNAVVAILLGNITSNQQKINETIGKRGAA
jgi:hypothetical protein